MRSSDRLEIMEKKRTGVEGGLICFRSPDEAVCVDRKVLVWCFGGVPSTMLTGFHSINEPQAFGKDFDHHFGRGGSELLDMNASDFDAIATSLLSKMNKTHKEPRNLKEYSPWMSEFRAEFLRNELEVPGKFPFSVGGELSPLQESCCS